MASASALEKTLPLHNPRRIRVDPAADSGEPLVVHLARRRLAVESVLERWRIDDEWWRDRPISRVYYRLLLEDGRTMDVYKALRTDHWFQQAY